MNKYILMNCICCTAWGAFVALCYSNNGDENIMEFVENVLIAVVPAVVSAIVAIISMRNSQLNKNTNSINKLTQNLGFSNNKNLSAKISDDYSKIVNDIGVDNKHTSLTNQHDLINESLSEKFNLIETRYKDEDDRLRRLSDKQLDIRDTIKSFVVEFEKLNQEEQKTATQNSHLNDEIKSLKLQIKQLTDENNKLRKHTHGEDFQYLSERGEEDENEEDDFNLHL